jgi:hypothetical protein
MAAVYINEKGTDKELNFFSDRVKIRNRLPPDTNTFFLHPLDGIRFLLNVGIHPLDYGVTSQGTVIRTMTAASISYVSKCGPSSFV